MEPVGAHSAAPRPRERKENPAVFRSHSEWRGEWCGAPSLAVWPSPHSGKGQVWSRPAQSQTNGGLHLRAHPGPLRIGSSRTRVHGGPVRPQSFSLASTCRRGAGGDPRPQPRHRGAWEAYAMRARARAKGGSGARPGPARASQPLPAGMSLGVAFPGTCLRQDP